MMGPLNIPISPADKLAYTLVSGGLLGESVIVNLVALVQLESGAPQQYLSSVSVADLAVSTVELVPGVSGILMSVGAELDQSSYYLSPAVGVGVAGVSVDLLRGSNNNPSAFRLRLLDGAVIGDASISTLSRSGHGWRRVKVSDGAAGGDVTFSPGDGNSVRYGLISWLYTASSGIATRTPTLVISGDNLPGPSLFTYASQQSVLASGSVRYHLGLGLNRYSVSGSRDVDALPDCGLWDGLVTLSATNKQAGDIISDISIVLMDAFNSFF